MMSADPAGIMVRAAIPADTEAVAAIYAHYVTDTVVTFEEVPPAAADWRRRLDNLAGRNLPFLVAEQDGAVLGYAYASPWRPSGLPPHRRGQRVHLPRADRPRAGPRPARCVCSTGASRPASGRSSR